MLISLVVDDEASIRKYVSTILQREHFRTLEAEDGAQALQILEELDGSVDLIVSDIQMPNVDGLTLAYAARRLFPVVPVILASGNARPDAPFEFVEKPFSPKVILHAVRRVFGTEYASPW